MNLFTCSVMSQYGLGTDENSAGEFEACHPCFVFCFCLSKELGTKGFLGGSLVVVVDGAC